MPPTERLVARLRAERFPAVLLNSAHPRLWSVGVDHTAAAERAVTYCAGLGHRRIALVDRAEDHFDSFQKLGLTDDEKQDLVQYLRSI